ncbi:MAG: GtrA family protein [Candidatus Andeanibacterium colombiense]|uniref:GtrA family protein n=1 Tax=Candidatus Andeanibacterium colombiense TaxID=3121345 RepID=A0AAJ6BNI0_9SPHN|nr:MAG: GtrA family protein [Sphingomonadaceae bacterium]
MIALAARLLDNRMMRYLLASVIALGADMGSFFAMYALGVFLPAAYAASYTLGILVHWLISSRLVFADTVAERGLARTRQKALFVGSALMGLALTTAVGSLSVYAGVHPVMGKLIAVAASFVLTWLLRIKVVFRDAGIA